MSVFMGFIRLPLMVLNGFGGIVSGIWLAILGEWSGIGVGLLACIIGFFLCKYLLVVMLLFHVPAKFMIGKGSILTIYGYIVFIVGMFWPYLVVSVWAQVWFNVFLSLRADSDSDIPYLIWAYGVATAPWVYLAIKDAKFGSLHLSFFLQIAAASTIVVVGFINMNQVVGVHIFAGIMLFGYVMNIIMGGALILLEERNRRTNYSNENDPHEGSALGLIGEGTTLFKIGTVYLLIGTIYAIASISSTVVYYGFGPGALWGTNPVYTYLGLALGLWHDYLRVLVWPYGLYLSITNPTGYMSNLFYLWYQ